MSFQSSVNLYPAAAVAGDRASQNPTVYMPFNYKAGSAAVKVGGFVWNDSTNADEVVAAGSGAPLGFVERELNKVNYNLTSEGTLTLSEGSNLAVAVKGDFYVVADGTVTVGMKAYASLTTGAVTFDDAGETKSGYIETSFKALTAGASGDLIVMSNWA